MPRRSARPLLQDVANLAKVSLTTASLALSGRMAPGRLSQGCIDRVKAAATKLGYHGNYQAITLRMGRSFTIGLTLGAHGVGTLHHPFWGSLCGGVEEAARARGYDVLMIGGSPTVDVLARALQLLQAQRIDALVVLRPVHWQIPKELLSTPYPMVLVLSNDVTGQPRIRFDQTNGLHEAVAHLAGLGHRHLVWLGQRGAHHKGHELRSQVFLRSARSLGLSAEIIGIPDTPSIILPNDVTEFCRALRTIALPASATGIICSDDAVAIALLHVLAERGVAVPAQVSVVGFDDLIAQFAYPRLTTISHRLSVIGVAGANLAIDLLDCDGPIDRTQVITIPSALVLGDSTGPAPPP